MKGSKKSSRSKSGRGRKNTNRKITVFIPNKKSDQKTVDEKTPSMFVEHRNR